jgi:hypothetical protein
MFLGCSADILSSRPPQIADADRKIATLYDMLDYQDATNVDKKGLPFTVIYSHNRAFILMLKLAVGQDGVRR